MMHDEDYEAQWRRQVVEFQPWLSQLNQNSTDQDAIQSFLAKSAGARFGKNSYVARSAAILTEHFVLGDCSLVAAGAVIRGNVEIGAHCSVNCYSHLAGLIRIGSQVRIAGRTSI